MSRSHGYEFEDVIHDDMDDATLFTPTQGRSPFIGQVKNRFSKRTKAAQALPSGLRSTPLETDYALFFYSIANLGDLNCLDSLGNWRSRAGVAICWIQELWLGTLAQQPALADRLNEFDYVICSFIHTSEALKKQLSVPVIYLPWGVDTLHFCPYPTPPRRGIDQLSIGVGHPDTHMALIDHADRTGQFYSYDTISGRAIMQDHRAHRHNYVGQLQRSRYFFSYIAKVERVEERRTQVEFGLRYLEGAAAGAVVLGNRIDSDAFREHVGWEDAVIETPYECTDIGDIIDALDSQPDRLEEIRLRNILECLKRHDHLYRWEKVLDLAGMEPHLKMQARRKALAKRIQMVEKRSAPLSPTG